MAKEKEVKKPSIAELKAQDPEAILKDKFDWVSYDEMQKRVEKGDILKEVHKFGDEKLYGFIKGK